MNPNSQLYSDFGTIIRLRVKYPDQI